MGQYRTEKDLLGECRVPATALFGVHTVRAQENFPLAMRPVRPPLIHAYGAVKLACARANAELGLWNDAKAKAMFAACEAMREGLLDDQVVVDALQGGAGTSTNMNVNEVLANKALQLLGSAPGDYETVSPLGDINRHQSTNDTFPTALKVAAIHEIQRLEAEVVALVEAFQAKEKQLVSVVKIGRTQMQDAVLTTLGREMSAYADAFARDRWRIYKCEERLRVVNLGGTAIGTGLSAPRRYVFRVVDLLREITGLGLARAENLVDATQNADVFVEVSGILKAHASTLLKVASDLRFLSSGPDGGIGEIRLPQRQAGSSIMPGKVNPVIPEAVSQTAMMVMANDQAITLAASMGHLELNPFVPLIADALLGSIELLTHANRIFRTHCVEGIEADQHRCRDHVASATAGVTALVERIGYAQAQSLVQEVREGKAGLREIVLAKGLLSAEEFDTLVSPEAVTRLGSPDEPQAS